MRYNRYVFLVFTVIFSIHLIAQENGNDILFKNGDRVCFIGNSITANGQFCNFISLYYATRFPDQKVRFFNCGISGNTATGVIKRLDKDILIHHPTWSIIMLGMNDVSRSLYAPGSDTIQGIKEKRQGALDNYKKNLESIIKTLLHNNSKVILQKPSIYDQTGLLKATNEFGVNDALGICCTYIDELAGRYNLPVVDYWSILGNVNQSIQKKDPAATIIGADRVHPGVPGHFIMAYQFLRSTLKPAVVSLAKIDATKKNIHCDNCDIKDFGKKKSDIRFLCRLKSFPYPVINEAVPALEYIPFTDEYNQQILQIKGAKKGEYELLIDSIPVGKFTSEQLNYGINLALLKQSPQYKQSEKLLLLFEQYLKSERDIRSLRMVEFDFLQNTNATGLDSIKNFLDHLLSTQYAQSKYRNYYKSQFDHYIQSKANEGNLQSILETTFKQIYEMKTTFHLFEIVKIK